MTPLLYDLFNANSNMCYAPIYLMQMRIDYVIHKNKKVCFV